MADSVTIVACGTPGGRSQHSHRSAGEISQPLVTAQDPANITVTSAGSVVVRGPTGGDDVGSRCVDAAGARYRTEARPAVACFRRCLALAGSGLVAVLLHQPMFLLFGALGAIVAFGTWGGQRFSMFHRRRSDARRRRDEIAEFERAVGAQRAGVRRPSSGARLDTGLGEADDRGADRGPVGSSGIARRRLRRLGRTRERRVEPQCWTTRHDRPQGRRANLGAMARCCADLPLIAEIGASVPPRCPRHPRIGRADASARSCCSLLPTAGPPTYDFVVVTHEPARWRWLRGVAPRHDRRGSSRRWWRSRISWRLVAEYDVAPHPHLVVITDAPELLAARTSPLRRVAGRRPFRRADRAGRRRRRNPARVLVAARPLWSDQRAVACRCRARVAARCRRGASGSASGAR